MQFTKSFALAAVGLIVASGAYAEGKGGHGERGGRGMERAEFSQLDANADGQLTQAEMQAHRTAKFAEQDTDGNGELSKEEIAAARPAKEGADADKAAERAEKMSERMDEMFTKMDADKSGGLSQAEMTRDDDRQAKHFERMDADENGSISEEEYNAQPKGKRK